MTECEYGQCIKVMKLFSFSVFLKAQPISILFRLILASIDAAQSAVLEIFLFPFDWTAHQVASSISIARNHVQLLVSLSSAPPVFSVFQLHEPKAGYQKVSKDKWLHLSMLAIMNGTESLQYQRHDSRFWVMKNYALIIQCQMSLFNCDGKHDDILSPKKSHPIIAFLSRFSLSSATRPPFRTIEAR